MKGKTSLSKVIYDALKDFGGEAVVNSLLWYLNHQHNMSLDDVIKKPEEFVSFLKEVYGDFEPIIENHLVEKISKAYGINPGKGLIETLKKFKEEQT